MRSQMVYKSRYWLLSLPLMACGADGAGLTAPGGRDGSNTGASQGSDFYGGAAAAGRPATSTLAQAITFPGAGTSGAAGPLLAALAPETSSQCDPEPSVSPGATSAEVQTVCFFGPDSEDEPAAVIEQVVEVVGTEQWVHLRLTLNPDFVDNTYGDTAIGWGDEPGLDAGPPPPPAPPMGPPIEPPAADAGAPREPGARPGRAGPRGAPRARAGRAGHTFRDLVGSDHAEIQLLDASGEAVVHFKLDYLSESSAAASGYASLGVTGGEGQIIVGEPEWFLATATSLERNLEACGLASFTESSPATDAAYGANPEAPNWDYRVSYEAWVSSEAFGAAGFGSALIENVHASPSKLAGNTVDVAPAPCPEDPSSPEAAPLPVPEVLQNLR